MDVIINADDLGISDGVNDKIFDLLGKGKITSATILANGPALEEAVNRLNKYSGGSFGVHLNLTQFEPVGSGSGLEAILDENGNFDDNIRDVFVGPRLISSIVNEFCSQIDRLISLGVQMNHIDSHHHVHTIPSLLPVMFSICNYYDIYKVRINQNIYPLNENISFLKRAGKKVYNFILGNFICSQSTEGFGGFVDFYERSVNGCSFDYDTVELMVHPGSSLFRRETKLLESSWQEEIPFDVNLIGYGELGESSGG